MGVISVEEQESIRRSARAFVRERAPVGHLRALRDGRATRDDSRALWREMAQLGLAAASLPERWGGAGLGLAEAGIVAEELGRNLAPTPFLSIALAGSALADGARAQNDGARAQNDAARPPENGARAQNDAARARDTDALRDAVLPRLCAGETVVALAHDEGTRFAPYAIETRAERQAEGFVVHGRKSFVLDAGLADAFVVVARTSGARGDREGLTLLYVKRDAAGVWVEPLAQVDSRDAGRVRLEGVRVDEGSIVGEVGAGAAILDRALDRGTAILAAEMLGGMQSAFDRTLEYLKTRRQFGAPIGSFQALKHRAAWMFCEIELTRSVVLEALAALDAGRPDAPELVSAAKARASDTYLLVTNEAVQMHGGVGVTDELDVGLYMKRARVAEHTLGTAAYHRDRFARLRGY